MCAALAMLLFALTGCGSQEEPVAITAFQIGEISMPALEVDDGVTVAATEPSTYAYLGVEDVGSVLQSYVASMTTKENGFRIVDAAHAAADAPDFTQEKGEVILAKNVEDDKSKLLTATFQWSPKICTVVLKLAEAPNAVSSSTQQALTHTDAADRVKGMSPSAFGLSGESMDAYNVYIRNGLVMVNGEPCIWVEIYTNDTKAGTNACAGVYYMSRDGKRLHVLDRTDNTVKPLQVNG